MPEAGGLSDVLGQLASEDQPRPDDDHEAEIELRSPQSLRAEETAVMPVDQFLNDDTGPADDPAGGERPAAARAASAPGPERLAAGRPAARRRPPRKDAYHDLKRTAIPILITVGMVLLIPGLWAVALLAGVEVPRHTEPDARNVAIAMLITWPLSLCMIAGAIYFWVQTSKAAAHTRR